MAKLQEQDLRALKAALRGQVIAPGDADYDKARSLWNGVHDRRPGAIARCVDAADVAAALKFARSAGMEVSVRGGGHHFAGLAAVNDGLMIHLGAMNGVTVDAAARRAVCGGGATWAELDGATQAHGLATVGGFISHTGVGGLTLGGGIGWLTKKAGLTVDNLLGAEVVTADGRVLRASSKENPELFWALRGGGGNFGVVTSLEFALHPVGPLVSFGLFFWPVDHGIAALHFARDLIRKLPAEVTGFIGGLNAPPAPFVPPQHHFVPGFALVLLGLGTPEQHGQVAEQVRSAQPPLFDLVTPMPYVELQKMFDPNAPWGACAYEKALYLDELSDAAIAVIVDQLPRKGSPLSFMPVFSLDGAYGRVADDATAFGGPRSARYVVNIAAICPTRDGYDADRAWVRGFWEALEPHASNTGGYVNFMNDADDDRVRTAYGAKYERLARVKRELDPDNVFHLNANVKPA